MNHLTLTLAQAIEDTLGNPRLLGLAADTAKSEIVEKNRRALAQDLAAIRPTAPWLGRRFLDHTPRGTPRTPASKAPCCCSATSTGKRSGPT